ncbi:hypothetical protein N0V90_004606 [Kalmusia sp. IMI 367209]|nr:hypothetical protein N0V90_004606 [Kalmusia sp. IMI 367209]
MEESANGFVGTLLDAYRQHNHVVLRPEDVWFAILVQFSFYVNNHAEKLREHFVDHSGKLLLHIEQESMNMPAFVLEITNMLQRKIKDTKFRDWIMPNFTTTTQTDRVTASIIMMGTMQKFFVYSLEIGCGIPSVTLLGEQKDWQDILDRLDFLDTFGKEHPELLMWQSVLKAIVGNMVQTFIAPDSPDVVRFWQRTVHSHTDDYSGDKQITGWILGFCFWDTKGEPLVARGWQLRDWEQEVAKRGNEWWFDEKRFWPLEWKEVPAAFVQVPIHVAIKTVSPPDKFVAKAVAGSVGYMVQHSATVFNETRHGGRKGSDISSETLTRETLTGDKEVQKPGILKRIMQMLPCLESDCHSEFGENEKVSLYTPIKEIESSLSLSEDTLPSQDTKRRWSPPPA